MSIVTEIYSENASREISRLNSNLEEISMNKSETNVNADTPGKVLNRENWNGKGKSKKSSWTFNFSQNLERQKVPTEY